MTIHNGQISPGWRKVKAKVIERFGTVEAAAVKLNCHPNSVRNAAEGRSPGILKKLLKLLP